MHWKNWCWGWSSNTLVTWCKELTYWKRPWRWERLRAGGDGDDRGWDGWMASLTRSTWVWASSGRWSRTGKLGILQSTALQRVGHDWATEQQSSRKDPTASYSLSQAIIVLSYPGPGYTHIWIRYVFAHSEARGRFLPPPLPHCPSQGKAIGDWFPVDWNSKVRKAGQLREETGPLPNHVFLTLEVKRPPRPHMRGRFQEDQWGVMSRDALPTGLCSITHLG